MKPLIGTTVTLKDAYWKVYTVVEATATKVRISPSGGFLDSFWVDINDVREA